MANLTKTFETKKDGYGFKNGLTVNVEYNEEENSIDNLEVSLITPASAYLLTSQNCLRQSPNL